MHCPTYKTHAADIHTGVIWPIHAYNIAPGFIFQTLPDFNTLQIFPYLYTSIYIYIYIYILPANYLDDATTGVPFTKIDMNLEQGQLMTFTLNGTVELRFQSINLKTVLQNRRKLEYGQINSLTYNYMSMA